MSRRRRPTHPGIILEEHYMIPLNITPTQLAKASGISRTTIYSIINTEGRVSANTAIRLAKVFNTTPDLWLNLQQKYDLWKAEQNKALRSETIKPLVPMVASSKK